MADDKMFTPLPGATAAKASPPARAEWVAMMPVPPNAPPAPDTHPTRGAWSRRYAYHDAAGALIGYVARFAAPGGGKDFLPLTWCRSEAGTAWRWKSWEAPRPLYGLDRLAARPSAPVVLCEGEKAADAAARLLPDHVAITSPHGSKSASKADWSPLRDRAVTIWPDADAPGAAYAAAVAKRLAELGVTPRLVVVPSGVAEGWDAADADRDGWTPARALELVQQARAPADDPAGATRDAARSAATSSSGRRGGGTQRDLVVGLIDGDEVELWHDADSIAFATIVVSGHHENHAVRSRPFRLWLTGRYYAAHRSAPGGQAFEDAIRAIEASAVNDGPQHATFLRVGETGAERLFLDLGTPDWRAAEMTAAGWRIVDRADCKMLRSPAMRALPVPEIDDGGIELLRSFINCDDEEFMLLVAWAIAALRVRGPFPILVFGGEQGSSKSTVSRILRGLIDANASPIRAAPRDDRDLLVSAVNSWVLAFDNLSSMPVWFSDGLARIASGSGFATRTLHSDRDETVFAATRPIILNGITDLAVRPDLQDRAVVLSMKRIAEEKREPERAFWSRFDCKAPFILGALLDGVCAGLRNLPTTKLDGLPRMADFALLAEAAASGLGWEPGAFSRIYSANRAGAIQVSLEHSVVAQALVDFIRRLIDPEAGFTGSTTELLGRLNESASEAVRKTRHWPATPSELGSHIQRIAPVLRGVRIGVETDRVGKDRRRVVRVFRLPAS